jgi:predicted enzyme related to lactoylglutathione lyase
VHLDLTVPNADEVRDFYAAVIGWRPEPLDMGGYADYMMIALNGEWGAGICHAHGVNADLPPQWMVYIAVDDLDQSLKTCVEQGGKLVTGIRDAGGSRYCVIQDPAGAVMALMEQGAEAE